MKKILSLFIALLFSYTAFAQVAFLKVEDTYSAEDDGVEHPELNAYDWFNTNYVSSHTLGNGVFIRLSDFAEADLSQYPVIWLAIGRSLDNKDALLSLFNETNRNKLKEYIKAGGNVFLSGHASYLSYSMGRVSEEPNTCGWNSAYAPSNDDWSVKINSSGHKVWSAFVDNSVSPGSRQDGTWYEYKLVGHDRNDRNCLWSGKDWNNFQDNQTCKIHGYWGNDNGPDGAGFVEFYPKDDWKGTILVNGLAAYQWGTNNTYLQNVKYLTQGILDYLSKRATATWTAAPKANPVIKDEENVTVTPGTNSTVTVTTSDPNIANYNEGHIYYNFFGNVTFTATATGDGVNIPKNAVLYPEIRTVTGGAAATYGYILPFSIHTISANGYNGDGNYLPDYLAALWFYNEYVSQGTGCFINPAEASIPSQVKVLWINSDKNGLSTENFDAAYAGTGFVSALTNYVNAGGNLLLTKQAVQMLRKLGRYDNGNFPSYANGGYMTNSDPWNIRNSFFAGDGAVNYSSHAIFKDLESPFTLIAGDHDHRTDNNNLIYDEVFNDKEAMQSFEGTHNCRILGTWPNAADNKCDRGVIAEFLPQTTTAGTIIEVGASAYQWNDKGTINLEYVHPNMKKLTSNILSYLYYSLNVYTREVTADLYGTICLPRASASVENATIWSVLKVADDNSGIMLQEVRGDEMEAGKPYFFYATATPIRVTMTGSAVLAPISGNGLVGNLGPATLTVPQASTNYILGPNILYYVDADNITIGANRAYLDRNAINAASPAPGRAVRKMPIHTTTNTATGLEAPEEDNIQPIKKFVNGHLYIQYGDKVYDITGNQIK